MRSACVFLLLLAACGGAEPLQVVRGSVVAEDLAPPHGIRALAGDALAASGPVEDGAFVLGLPEGRFRLELVGDAGALRVSDRSGAPLEVAICARGADPVDLGTIRLEAGRCPTAEACAQREAELARCERGCCCRDEREAYERCASETSDRARCIEARQALRACEVAAGCTATEAACAERCAPRREALDACADCDAGPIARAAAERAEAGCDGP